jgi:2-methylcitrate dehydratase PrpD
VEALNSIVDHFLATNYASIPSDVVGATKQQVLDTIGCALGGSTALGVPTLVEIVKDWGGKEESTVFCYGGKLPACHAAQVNATMAHALDYDDSYEPGILHPSVSVIPGALAMAERQGGVTGKEFITAVALGIDLVCRMGEATIVAKPHLIQGGWHFTAIYGYFSNAATAGKLLQLDKEQLINALGIAYHQCGGNVQCIQDGALTKRMGPGFNARAGISAAIMAGKGITGCKDSLEGERGIYNLYHAGFVSEKLTGGLGQRFLGANVSVKPYPCCRGNHYFIDVVLQLVRDNDIGAEDVEEINVKVHPYFYEALCDPIDFKRVPRNMVDAQFSIPWSLACAVVRRRAGLAEFSGPSLQDAALLNMAQRIKPAIDTGSSDAFSSSHVSIRTKNKGTLSGREDYCLGMYQNPMSMEAIAEKFRECADMALKPWPRTKADDFVQLVDRLEELDNLGPIFRMLGGD